MVFHRDDHESARQAVHIRKRPRQGTWIKIKKRNWSASRRSWWTHTIRLRGRWPQRSSRPRWSRTAWTSRPPRPSWPTSMPPSPICAAWRRMRWSCSSADGRAPALSADLAGALGQVQHKKDTSVSRCLTLHLF